MLKMNRLWLRGAKDRVGRWLLDEIVRAPVEPILHLSRTRLLWIGACTFCGHLIVGWIWLSLRPQPYENEWARLLMASLSLLYLLPAFPSEMDARQAGWLFSLATWLQLPLFFTWMYWMNGGNPVWLASVAMMILIYFHVTDWRLASFGLLTGGLAGWATAQLMRGGLHSPVPLTENAVVITFAILMGVMLGFSGANLRRTRLRQTLSTMAVMAHELRTPLATISLLGDVLHGQGQQGVNAAKQAELEKLAGQLQGLVHNMNRQIDTQISNAQLFRLRGERSELRAAALVESVTAQYPYKNERERGCVALEVQSDFCFLGSGALFAQVLVNLMKNALHAIAATGRLPQPGDLLLTVSVSGSLGRITVADRGVGISLEHQQRIFEPFFSTQSGVGSGLGLAFCKNVLGSSGGRIGVVSKPGQGAAFQIDVPLHITQPR